MKKLTIFTSLFLAFVFMCTYFVPFFETSDKISSDVFRLHILANSDLDCDQELKLKVRDAVLNYSTTLYNENDDLASIIAKSQQNIDNFKIIAENVIEENGYDYSAAVCVNNEYFSTRQYDSFTLPSGFYNSLKIEIGEAKGHNWWCIMFPAVCLPEVSDNEMSDYLTDDEMELVESNSNYDVRFKVVEIYNRMKDKMQKK